MEYLGTMLGHGKPITRKGTKKSGLGYTAEFEQGKVEVIVRDVEGVPHVDFAIYKGGEVHNMTGSFDSMFEAINIKEM